MGNRLAPASSRRHPPASNDGDVVVDVPVPALPHDVLLDILLRAWLPGKQLCRLRAVCRSWRAVLSDPLFVAAHAAGHPDLLVAAADADLLLDDDAALSGSGRRVVMRATRRRSGWPRYYPPHRYMRAHLGRVLVVPADKRARVLDPDTGAESLLPEPDHGVGRHGEPHTFFVLGWAPAASEGGGYKVLGITRDHRGREVGCKVLTLGSGAWREAPSTPVAVQSEPCAAAVADNGVVYFLAALRRIGADWIAAFDLRTERWRRGLIRGPPSNALSCLTTTTEPGGRLVAVSGSFSYASALHLWRLMNDDDDVGDPDAAAAVWHKMCTVHVSQIQRAGQRLDVAKPLWVLDGGRIALVVWSPTPGGYRYWVLRVYDPRTKGFQDVARMLLYTDVAIGVYGANNLLRAQGQGSDYIS